ncbi:MAG: EF-hand domain-containing protein [Campylobacterota bacterium]|nr:EF-hand domain-containing protein [Campylobacterota bacterium]
MKNLTKSILIVSLISSVAFAAPTAQQKFNSADTNNDGVLTSKEFYDDQARKMEKKIKEGKALKGVSTAPHFDGVDANNNGKVTFLEYDIFHTKRQKEMAIIKSKGGGSGKNFEIFTKFDKDGNGCISKSEFKELISSGVLSQGKGKGN